MQLEFGAPAAPRRAGRETVAAERARRARASRDLMRRLASDARRLCWAFSLRYRKLEAERAGVTSRYGACFSDGTIKIRLYHATTGRPLKYSSLIDTLCHELAHLRHFNHGKRFQEFYYRILAYARREGIYRPGPQGDSAVTSRRNARAPARLARNSRSAAVADQLKLFG